MAKSTKETPVELTEIQKKFLTIVSEKRGNVSINNIDIDKIALHKDSIDDYYSVIYDFTPIGVHINYKEIDEGECQRNSIKIWHTWTWNV